MSQDSHTQSPISQIGDMLDDGLILTNLDGVVLSANPAAVRWFGENLICTVRGSGYALQCG